MNKNIDDNSLKDDYPVLLRNNVQMKLFCSSFIFKTQYELHSFFNIYISIKKQTALKHTLIHSDR